MPGAATGMVTPVAAPGWVVWWSFRDTVQVRMGLAGAGADLPTNVRS
jgi:hypothetical protein